MVAAVLLMAAMTFLRRVDLPLFGPGRAKKRHSFHGWRMRRREALSIPEARRGVEASTARKFGAARSCTSGIDRRSRAKPTLRPETNVKLLDQPEIAPIDYLREAFGLFIEFQ